MFGVLHIYARSTPYCSTQDPPSLGPPRRLGLWSTPYSGKLYLLPFRPTTLPSQVRSCNGKTRLVLAGSPTDIVHSLLHSTQQVQKSSLSFFHFSGLTNIRGFPKRAIGIWEFGQVHASPTWPHGGQLRDYIDRRQMPLEDGLLSSFVGPGRPVRG